MAIMLKSAGEIEKMRASGRVLRQVLDVVRDLVRPGVSTMELETAAAKKIKELGAKSAFKGYNGFPAVLCTSVNHEVVHGIPSEKRLLKEGDIVSIDCGVILEGYYSDSAMTLPVGEKIDAQTEKLLKSTNESLMRAIDAVKPGATLGDIGAAVQETVEADGFSVVREFVGHGIGTKMHEDPQVPNYGKRGQGTRLREGMVLAIEPMVNVGKPNVQVLADGWTAVTEDGSLSAHFEHTVAVTRDGALVLTA